MTDNDEKKFVDELLEAGLARYSAAEPRPGLENRLLAGLRAEPQPSLWLDWRWAGALAAAAVAVVVLSVFYLRQPVPEPQPPAVAETVAPQPVPTATPSATPSQLPQIARATTRRPVQTVQPPRVVSLRLPRRATFPSRTPLSEQELLLLRYVQTTPGDQLVARQLGASPIGRLDFEPVRVPPLASQESPLEKKENN